MEIRLLRRRKMPSVERACQEGQRCSPPPPLLPPPLRWKKTEKKRRRTVRGRQTACWGWGYGWGCDCPRQLALDAGAESSTGQIGARPWSLLGKRKKKRARAMGVGRRLRGR